MIINLRTKGILSFFVFVSYVLGVTYWGSHERFKLLQVVEQMENVHARQQLVIRLDVALGHSIREIQNTLNKQETTFDIDHLAMGIQDVDSVMRRLQPIYPALISQDIDNFEIQLKAYQANHSRDNLIAIRDNELRLIEKFNEVAKALNEKRNSLSDIYRTQSETTPMIAIGLYMAGLSVYGIVIFLFFKRLSTDIKLLKSRAVAVAGGYRGDPLKVTRHDEVGSLIEAINRMQDVLLGSEQRQEISRQQRFHQEKMAAVGSLVSAIAHEVSNPMAAIAGISQEIIDHTTPPLELQNERRFYNSEMHNQAEMILHHTERIAIIMRRMSTLTDNGSLLPELLDLNSLVKATCDFIGYDKRFRGIRFELDLDPEISAVTAVSDHITQVLMNLLINAADAMLAQPAAKPALIRIASRENEGYVQLAITDTGHGMSSELLAKVFDEFFTTKPVGMGRGIGLYLCKSLIEAGGGDLTLESTLNVGTTVRLTLPLRPPFTEAA